MREETDLKIFRPASFRSPKKVPSTMT